MDSAQVCIIYPLLDTQNHSSSNQPLESNSLGMQEIFIKVSHRVYIDSPSLLALITLKHSFLETIRPCHASSLESELFFACDQAHEYLISLIWKL